MANATVTFGTEISALSALRELTHRPADRDLLTHTINKMRGAWQELGAVLDLGRYEEEGGEISLRRRTWAGLIDGLCMHNRPADIEYAYALVSSMLDKGW